MAASDGYIYFLRGRDLWGGAVNGVAHPVLHGIDGNFFVSPGDPPAKDIAVTNGYIYAIVGRDLLGARIDGVNHESAPVVVDANFIPDANVKVSMTAANGYLYWAYQGTLYGAKLNGLSHEDPAVPIDHDSHGAWDGDIAVAEVGPSPPPPPPPAASARSAGGAR